MGYIVREIRTGVTGALVIAGSIGKAFLGLAEMDSSGNIVFIDGSLLTLYSPFLLKEGFEPIDNKGNVRVETRVDPLYFSVGYMDNIIARFDNLYALKSESPNDQKVFSLYVNTLNQALAQKSGLVAPSMDDIRKLGGN